MSGKETAMDRYFPPRSGGGMQRAKLPSGCEEQRIELAEASPYDDPHPIGAIRGWYAICDGG
jgi:hypothetical protein